LPIFLDSLVFLILVVENGIFNFEGSDKACIVPEKGALGANHGVNLTHGLHDLQLIVVELGGHQIDIPHREVSVEKDDSLHGQLCQVGVILHELSVQSCEGLRRVRKLSIRECLYELPDGEVPQH